MVGKLVGDGNVVSLAGENKGTKKYDLKKIVQKKKSRGKKKMERQQNKLKSNPNKRFKNLPPI